MPRSGATAQNDRLTVVEGLETAYRDDFPGTGPPRSKFWTQNVVATGVVDTTASSLVTLANASATVQGGVAELIGTIPMQAPARMVVVLNGVVRGNSGETAIEWVEVNADPSAEKTTTVTGGDVFGVRYVGSANASIADVYGRSGGDDAAPQSGVAWVNTSGQHVVELDLTVEEALAYAQAAPDSVAARSAAYRINRRSPDPEKFYVPRIRVRSINTSSTQVSAAIDSVMVENYTHQVAEVRAGRGALSANDALGVSQVGAFILSGGTSRIGQVASDAATVAETLSTTAPAASATVTGSIRDAAVVTQGSSTRGDRFRAIASGTAAFTLLIETATDNAFATADPVVAVAAAQPVTGGRYVATAEVPVVQRYHRASIVNGVTANSAMRMSTLLKG